jgi:ubiquinone/menaquinone biosynthesis C-methylase UbiE
MTQAPIRFDDGAAYERMMGTWSRLAGAVFLDWLAPRPGLRWIDIGCGNGCFTELIVERCAPVKVVGIDPSEGQLAFARERPAAQAAVFQRGDAMALPFPEDNFDAAVMALVVFFLPKPAGGIAEMTRVVRRGGVVASYSWDMLGGGFPLEPIRQEMAAMGIALPLPPSAAASQFDMLRELWAGAGLEAVETHEITVQRTFADFEDFWTTSLRSVVGTIVAAMASADVETLKARLSARLPTNNNGSITYAAQANAIRGRVPT